MSEDLERLSSIVSPIAEKYGVKRIYLFGSRARGDDNDDSDYDFLMVMGDVKNILVLFAMINDLEDALGRHVDVVEDKLITDERFRYSIEKEKILIYSAAC